MNYNDTVELEKSRSNINLNFWLLLMGKIVSQLGDGIFTIALPWYILSVTGKATAMSAYLVIANLSCGIALLLFSRLIDSWRKEKVMYLADYSKGFYILFLFLTVSLNLPYKFVWIYLGAVVLNVCSALFNPASMSIIPAIIEEKKLVKANSVLSIVDNTIVVLGLAMGVAVYELLGIKLVFLITGISYVAAAFFEMFIRPDRSKETDNKNAGKTGIIPGLNYLFHTKKILFIILFALVWNYIYISIFSIYLPYIFNVVYKSSISSVATINMVEAIGLILGATIASKINISDNIYRNLTKVVFLQMPVFILFTVVLFLNETFIHSILFVVTMYMLLFFVLGITVAVVNVNVCFIIQSETDSNFLGRVNSYKSLGSMISMALGLLIGGILIERINIVLAFGINSVLFIFLVIFMFKQFYKKAE